MKESLVKTIFRSLIEIGCFAFLVSVFLFLSHPFSIAEDVTGDTVEKTPEVDVQLVEGGESLDELGEDYYFGVFVDADRVWDGEDDSADAESQLDSKSLNLSIDEPEPEGTLFIGKKLIINGVPVGIKLDSGLDALSVTDRFHFNEGDEITDADKEEDLDKRWIVTARAGLETELEPGTLFASGGVIVTRASDSIIDIEMGVEKPPQGGDNSSSGDDTIQLGWVFGLGVELPLEQNKRSTSQSKGSWFLRIEGTYIKLDGNNNPSGGNACETRSSLNLCSSNEHGETTVARIAIVRLF